MSIVKICQVWEMEAGGSNRETEAFSKKAKRGMQSSAVESHCPRGGAAMRGDLSRSVAPNHMKEICDPGNVLSLPKGGHHF